jgi:hypothetical protein
MMATIYEVLATELATKLANGGMPVAAAKELGRYVAGLETRIAELNQRVTDLARSSGK